MAPYRVDVSRIAKAIGESLPVRGPAALDPLEKGGDRIEPLGPAEIDVVVESVGEGAFTLRGSVEADVALTCGRCLKRFETRLAANVQAFFMGDSEPTEEAFPVDGHFIDMAPALAEALLLEVPYSPVCCEECPGLCPVCGADPRDEPCGCKVDVLDPRLAVLGQWKERARVARAKGEGETEGGA